MDTKAPRQQHGVMYGQVAGRVSALDSSTYGSRYGTCRDRGLAYFGRARTWPGQHQNPQRMRQFQVVLAQLPAPALVAALGYYMDIYIFRVWIGFRGLGFTCGIGLIWSSWMHQSSVWDVDDARVSIDWSSRTS